MGMINLSQVKNGARLRHADIKKINVQKFPITSDTSVTKFKITNKPEGAKYTYLYDTLSISAQIEINHNIYYEFEDFYFDKDTGIIDWCYYENFEITKDLCDSIRVIYAYTYDEEKEILNINHNRYVFNKNDVYGPMNIDINGKTCLFTTYCGYGSSDFKTEYYGPLVEFEEMYDKNGNVTGVDGFRLCGFQKEYTSDIYRDYYPSGDGTTLETFFKDHSVKLLRESDGAGLIFKGLDWTPYADATRWFCCGWNIKNSKQASDTTCTINDLYTAFNNGENLIFEVEQ